MKTASENKGKQRRRHSLTAYRFPKGRSGNPNGRPRKTAAERAETKWKRQEVQRLAREVELRRLDVTLLTREYAELAVKVLVDVASTSKDDDTRCRAASELLNRGFGKATEFTIAATADITPDPERQRLAAEAMIRLKALFNGAEGALARLPATVDTEVAADAS